MPLFADTEWTHSELDPSNGGALAGPSSQNCLFSLSRSLESGRAVSSISTQLRSHSDQCASIERESRYVSFLPLIQPFVGRSNDHLRIHRAGQLFRDLEVQRGNVALNAILTRSHVVEMTTRVYSHLDTASQHANQSNP